MTPVCGRDHPYWEHHSVALFNSSLTPCESQNKLSDQPVKNPKARFPIAVVSAIAATFPKYSKENFQLILKPVPEVWASTLFKEPWNKSLKARSPDIYYENFYMEYYNLYQQCKDYFSTARAKGTN